jgi:hypothetical protein
MGEAVGGSELSSLRSLTLDGGGRADRIVRLVFLALVAVVLVAAVAGWTGPVRAQVSASGDEVRASIDYDRITRPGLAVSWRLTVETLDGSPLPALEVAVPNDYFDLFDENGLSPVPDSESSDGDRTIWELEPQDGSTLTLVFDARVAPGWHSPEEGDTTVTIGDDVLHLDYRTVVLP